MVKRTAKKWIRSEADERAIAAGCYFEPAAGKHACDFFERYCVHSRGAWAGQPFKLLPWQRNDFLMPLFGWRRADGLPRFQKANLWCSKKTGKSTMAAGLANYFICAGGRRSEVFGAAFTREQASIVYREAAAMAKASPQLARRLTSVDSKKRVLCRATDSFYQALAAEAGAVEGLIASLVIFDELHIQKTRVLWDALRYACDSSPGSLLLSISTVGVADQKSIWWEEFQYSKGVLDGTIHDISTFALIYQADEACKDDTEMAGKPSQWRKACPSLGVTVPVDKYKDAYTEARQSPGKWNNYLRYKLNIPTSQFSRIIDMDKWQACCGEVPDLSGEMCYGGLDLASSEDLAAFVLYFPRPDGVDYVKSWFWLPEATIEKRRQKGHHMYQQWVEAGWITVTPGEEIDHDVIAQTIVEAINTYHVDEIGYDAWNAANVAKKVELEGGVMVKVSQTMSGLALGTKHLLEEINRGGFRQESPVLTGMAGNVAAVEDHAGNQRPAKDESADKIDGIVALIMAVGRAMLAPQIEDIGPLFL
jgi:phage terminase large subunit-like protein